jgi:hypothetical protein
VIYLFIHIFLIISGMFSLYDPVKNPNEPVGKAFSAGIYHDGTQAYVGTGNVDNCGTQTVTPGRISTSSNLQGAGVNVLCHNEQLMTTSVTFLKNHTSLRWMPADQNNASMIPNAIKIKDDSSSDGFFIGRIKLKSLALETETEYTQVAKVHIDNGKSNLWYADKLGIAREATSEFEVLTCSPLLTLFASYISDQVVNNIQPFSYRLFVEGCFFNHIQADLLISSSARLSIGRRLQKFIQKFSKITTVFE